jgi:hypothetical protein
MALAMAGAYLMTSVGDAWKYLFNLTAGVGLVMILRWYWWRVNAWSEIAALATSALVSNFILIRGVFAASDPDALAKTLLVTVPVTTVVWIAVTLCTRPESQETLVRFYERVHPAGAGWRPIAALVPGAAKSEPLGVSLIDWIAGCGLVYGTLFGIGRLVLAEPAAGSGWLALAALCAAVIIVNVRRYQKAAGGAPAAALEALAPRG